MVDENSVTNFVESFLEHARPYDPQKAHEYYLKTRELKGRAKGRAQVVADKQTQSDADGRLTRKKQVDNSVNRLSTGLSTKKQAQVAALSDKAKKDLTKLTDQLGAWADKLRSDHEAARQKVGQTAEEKIQALPLLPRNAGAALKEQRAKNIEKIRGDAAAEQQKLDAGLDRQIEAKRTEIRAQKDVVVDNLRTAVKKLAGNAAN